MQLFQSFRFGAEKLVQAQYGSIHHKYGISQPDWDLLTQEENWTQEESRTIRAILANTVEVTLQISGIPATPLPAQYVAAVIATVVGPNNRFVACHKAPDTFDALAASGMQGEVTMRPAEREQIVALMLAYSGGFGGEPMPKPDPEGAVMAKRENKK